MRIKFFPLPFWIILLSLSLSTSTTSAFSFSSYTPSLSLTGYINNYAPSNPLESFVQKSEEVKNQFREWILIKFR